MEFKLLSENLLKELHKITVTTKDIIKQADISITLCRNLLSTFKKEVINKGFDSIEEEIEFFKKIKQVALVQLIYYSEVRSFEIQLPKANYSAQRKFIKKKINKLNRFFLYNMDFAQYIEAGYNHFDEQYFTRNFLENYYITSSKFYFQDPDFSTPRDMLLGKLKGYNSLLIYLQNRLIDIAKIPKKGSLEINNLLNLQWTSTKADLTELIYALHHSKVINNGNIGIKEIAIAMQQLLQFDLGDFYKIYSEIKTRKISRTKFLDELSAGLRSQMDKSEE